jgi:hypothetical protein
MTPPFDSHQAHSNPASAFLSGQQWVEWPRKPLGKGGPGKASHGMANGGKSAKSKGGRSGKKKGY